MHQLYSLTTCNSDNNLIKTSSISLQCRRLWIYLCISSHLDTSRFTKSGHLNTFNAPACHSAYILHLSSVMGLAIPSVLWGIQLQLYILRIFFLWWTCSGCCCCLVKKLWLALCYSMDCSTLGFNCLSLSPGVCSNWYPLSQWCQLIISSSLPALNLSQHQDLF